MMFLFGMLFIGALALIVVVDSLVLLKEVDQELIEQTKQNEVRDELLRIQKESCNERNRAKHIWYNAINNELRVEDDFTHAAQMAFPKEGLEYLGLLDKNEGEK